MDTPLATARIVRFLEQEPVVWLSTVRPDGSPHLVPTWFWWDGEALLVFSKPDARKVRNLRANPSVMLALGDAEDDFDIGLVEARAELLDRPTEKVLPVAHLTKYADQFTAIGLTAAEYAATYSQVIRIVPRGYPRLARADDATKRASRRGSPCLAGRTAPRGVRGGAGRTDGHRPQGGSFCHGSSGRHGSGRRSSGGSVRRSGAGCANSPTVSAGRRPSRPGRSKARSADRSQTCALAGQAIERPAQGPDG